MNNGRLGMTRWRVPLMVFILILTFVLINYQSHSLPEPALKDLAKSHTLSLGVYLARKRIHEPEYDYIAKTQFDSAVIDGQPNWKFNDSTLRPSPTEFDFSALEEVMHYAKANNMPIRLQHLVWGEEKWLPEWLKNGNYSKDDLYKILQNHITTIGKKYQGQVEAYTVVNEAFTRNIHEKGLRDWWADATGDTEYINQAFSWAKEADPSAHLILNDFNNEVENRISDAMYMHVKDMVKNYIPIDGIGMQMHIDGSNPPDKEAVKRNMRRFGELGLEVYVTEFDVNMADYRASPSAKLERQARIYEDMLRSCIESTYCHNFSYLGITDKESWYNELGVTKAEPLFFNRSYRPKPAFFGIRKALVSK